MKKKKKKIENDEEEEEFGRAHGMSMLRLWKKQAMCVL